MRRVVTALTIACAAAAGCGGDDDKGGGGDAQAGKVAKEYLAALAAGNDDKACGLLSEAARREAIEEVTAALGTAGLTCREAVRELSNDIAPEDKRVFLNPEVRKVSVDGDHATAEVVKVAQPVLLRMEGDDWRVDRSRYDVER